MYITIEQRSWKAYKRKDTKSNDSDEKKEFLKKLIREKWRWLTR